MAAEQDDRNESKSNMYGCKDEKCMQPGRKAKVTYGTVQEGRPP
jgi:hypothetical protein